MQVGDIISFERTFTKQDVEQFTNISGDEGTHHVQPNEQGQLMIQGLLTATLPTKIGGAYNVIARTMAFEFLRPVFTGDTIVCEVSIDQYEKQAHTSTKIHTTFTCMNQHGKEVLKGTFSGVIR